MRWLELQPVIPSDYFRVLSALILRVGADVPLGLSVQELSRMSGMSTLVVCDAIDWFKKYPDGKPLIHLRKVTDHYRMTLDEYYLGQRKTIPFTFDNTDEKRLAFLEKEFKTVRGNRYTDRSGLAQAVKPSHAALIDEIEYTLGRAITIPEAFYLGELLSMYDSERFLKVFRQQRQAQAPLRTTYVILKKGKLGAAMERDEPKPIKYREL